MRCALLAGVNLLALAACSNAEEPTIGEREFLRAVGHERPVIQLWPQGETPDQPRPIPAEEFRTEDPLRHKLHFLRELSAAKIPAECPVDSRGGHGGGIDPVPYPTSQ